MEGGWAGGSIGQAIKSSKTCLLPMILLSTGGGKKRNQRRTRKREGEKKEEADEDREYSGRI